MFTRSLALYRRQGIRVNVLCPEVSNILDYILAHNSSPQKRNTNLFITKFKLSTHNGVHTSYCCVFLIQQHTAC